MDKSPERFLWAVEVMDIKPNDQVLEIGCGAGLLAEQIALRLDEGHVTAIDRSVPMVKMAEKRNKSLVERGICDFWTGDFSKYTSSIKYNKIVGFNVNFFWKKGEKELYHTKDLMEKDGLLYVFYQAPYEIDITAAEPIRNTLEPLFLIRHIYFHKMKPASSLCIIASK